ncbi:MAG TPA: hypothetical protein VHC95_13145 [Opitutales bacterium]|nr:hypothetical protein [Opitutales bacterium]
MFDPRPAPSRNKPTWWLLALLFLATAHAAQTTAPTPAAPAPVVFPQASFSIAPLEDAPGSVSIIPIIMALTPADQFASNVNVMIQPYAKPMSEYITLSKTQFKQIGAQVVSERTPNANEWICEYQASSNSREMHFYAHAISSKDHVYLATGTTLESHWAADSAKVKKCVDSFKVLGAAPAAK